MSRAITDDFLAWFKQTSERRWWRNRWLPGLSEPQLLEYEQLVGARFPDDFLRFLTAMNGTHGPLRGERVEEVPYVQYAVYSYPRDLLLIQDQLREIEPYAEEVAEICEVERTARFVPLDGHFYVICESDPAQSKVCSVSFFDDYGGSVVDGVLIEDSLQDYLVKWFIVMGPFDWRCALFNPVGFVFRRLLGTIRYLAAVRAAWRTIRSIR